MAKNMSKAARMMMMSGAKNRDYREDMRQDYDRMRHDYDRMDRDAYRNRERGYMGEYERPEYRDFRGREHYENGRYAPERGRREYNRREDGRDEYFFKVKGKVGHKDGEYGEMPDHLDRETAEKWVAHMDKADGSGKGGKWSYDQTMQAAKQKGIDCDPAELYAVMNMLHSDYGKTLAKYGVNTPEAYVELARDWLDDDDVQAGDAKTSMYYHCIVK